MFNVNLSIDQPLETTAALCVHPSQTAPSDTEIPNTLELDHWQEWRASGVAPALIAANIRSLENTQGYDYLCYGDLERTNTGRLTTGLLRRYAHTEAGGWWCNGLDPFADWTPMLWGCFKPNTPRIDLRRNKIIKYEHPPQVATRAFFLAVPDADRASIQQQSSSTLCAAAIAPPIAPPLPNATTDQPHPSTHFWSQVLANPEIPIILVEGAKKAGCLLSLGYAAIALPGIFNGRRVTRDATGRIWSESLIPDLALFATPGRPFYFCFDHETKPNTIKNVKVAILRTGKLLEAQGCSVQVITLPGPEKGVDDFVMAQGAAAFESVFAAARSLPAWQWQQNKQAELTWQPWHVCNTPDFTTEITQLLPSARMHSAPDAAPDAAPAPVIPTSGILVLSSAKGTGKTKAIAELIGEETKVIAVGHRIALMRNLCDRLHLGYKDDLDKANGQFLTKDGYTLRIGLCADSLLAIDPNQCLGGILVIDEFMQVLRHLITSSTCNQDGKRPGLLARLQQLIRAARWVILADADAADLGIEYIRHLKGLDTPTHLIRNDYRQNGFPVQMLATPSDDAIIQAIRNDLQDNKKLFIATDSIGSATALAKLIQEIPSVQAGIVINSETSGREAERQLITHPNQEVPRYSWVLATPSMATGVSIEIEHFDKVYGIFYGVTTDADITQALNRVRAPIPRVVWCAQQGKNFSGLHRSEYPRQIAQALKVQLSREAAVLRASLGCPDTLLPEIFELAWDNNPHLHLFTHLIATTNRAMWTLRHSVQERLRYEGNTLDILDVPADPVWQATIKQARSEAKAEHYQAVATAQLLTPEQVAALTLQETLQPEDKLSLEKSLVAEFLALEEVTAAEVEFYGQYHGGLLQLEALVLGSALSTQRDVQAIARQTQWGHGILPFDQPYYELKRFVRDRLGLLPFLDPHQNWSDADLEPLGRQARHYRQQVKEILGFSIPTEEKHASNGWIFRLLCNQLGLKVKTHFQGPRGKQVKYFAIAVEHYQTMSAILQRRHQRRVQTLTPAAIVAPDHASHALVSTPDCINNLGGERYNKMPATPASDPASTVEPEPTALQHAKLAKPKNCRENWIKLSQDMKNHIQSTVKTLLASISKPSKRRVPYQV